MHRQLSSGLLLRAVSQRASRCGQTAEILADGTIALNGPSPATGCTGPDDRARA
jgi:hypothetical protein